MFDGYWRDEVAQFVDPVGVRLHRAGVTANALTVFGVVTASAAAVVIGIGELRWGLVLVVAAALPDLLDGAVAKAAGPTSRRGAFFDSTADRVSDTLITGGVVWWTAERPAVEPALRERMAYTLPENPSIAVLPFSNLSADASQDYFADGMSEDLISATPHAALDDVTDAEVLCHLPHLHRLALVGER